MRRSELLVPVGGTSQLIAAVENGADAVYLGGTIFNARMRCQNFDLGDMEAAVCFAHKRGVRVYVTLNTLMRDFQLEKALDYAEKVAKIGADAVIVQDLGLGAIIREALPALELHLSTQAGVFGVGGAQAAQDLGYKRVVLAREMPIEAIADVNREVAIETEVFVHGALCFCYSGQCQMSRAMGGRSGNQGVCAQPCRLPYEKIKDGKKIGTSYALSPKDLCLIDHLDKLIEVGVNSFKIEGRLKSPEYVSTVTSIYRKYMDRYYDNGSYEVDFKDREKLLQIFNRGNFTDGYLFGENSEELLSMDLAKHQGIPLGYVSSVAKKKKGYQGSLCEIVVEEGAEPVKGDIIEFRRANGGVDDTGSAYITYVERLNQDLYRIGDIKGEIHLGDKVFRVISKTLNENASLSYNNKTLVKGKYIRTTPLDFEVRRNEEDIALSVISKLLAEPITIEKKIGKPLSSEDDSVVSERIVKLETALGKLGGTPFRLGQVSFTGGPWNDIKISTINRMRREAVAALEGAICEKAAVLRYDVPEYLSETLTENPFKEVYFYRLEDFYEFCSKNKDGICEGKTRDVVALLPLGEILLEAWRDEADRLTKMSRAAGFLDWCPYISNISMGKEDEIIRDNVTAALLIAKEKGVYLGSLEWYKLFSEHGSTLYGDYGLNAYNGATMAELNRLGFKWVEPSAETYSDDNGSYPLMTAQHLISAEALLDRKNMKIRIVQRLFSDQMVLKKYTIKWKKLKNFKGRVYY